MRNGTREINVMAMDVVSQSRCFGGTQFTYQHRSSETGTPMRFAAFVPLQADQGAVPVVWYLSGLTCTEENFTVKAGAQRIAAELGLLLVAPDTSPRGDGVPGDPKECQRCRFRCPAPQSSTGPRATPSATRTFSRPTPRCRP